MEQIQARFPFRATAAVIRALPAIRGKVRLGLALYPLLHRPDCDVVVDTTLFRERLKYQLHLRSAHERMAYLMGQYETVATDVLVALWESGSVLDIGANVGLISVPLAVRLGNARGATPPVYAVEPLASNLASLRHNIAANGLEQRVTVLPVALSAEAEGVSIRIEGGDPSATGTAHVIPESFDNVQIRMATVTLDSLVADGTVVTPVGLMKIVTSGYDLSILRGARTVLERDRPMVLAEFNTVCMGWHGHSLADVTSFLREVAYELWTPVRFGAPVYRLWREDQAFFVNCLAVPSEKRDVLRRCGLLEQS